MLCDSQQWPSAASILQRSSRLLISMPFKSQLCPQEVSWEDDNTHTHTHHRPQPLLHLNMHALPVLHLGIHGCHLALKTNAGAENWISDQRNARRRTARRQSVQRVQHTEAVSPIQQRTAPVDQADCSSRLGQSCGAHGARAPLPAERKDFNDLLMASSYLGLLAKAHFLCIAIKVRRSLAAFYRTVKIKAHRVGEREII